MPDQPYTFYQGHAASGPMLRDRRPALIVLGDLDAARAALEASAVNGDTRTRAIDAARSATREWFADESGRDREEFVVDALAAAGLLRGPETSSAAPEGAALSASGTVRRAGGPDHGTAPVGDAVPDASAITFAAWVAAMVGGRDA